jgi:hypothetical protein
MDQKPTFFARIEAISPDIKPGWFQVKMLVLQMPLVVVTWILRDAQINGEEFTMGGRPMRLEKVVAPEESLGESSSAPETEPAPEPEKLPAPAARAGGEEASSEQGSEKEQSAEDSEATAETGRGKVISLEERRKKTHPSS